MEQIEDHLRIVSHELRSPLTVVLGSARLLRERGDMLDEGDKAELLDSILSEASKLGRLIENLLLLTRVEFGRPIEKSPVNLKELLDRVAAKMLDRPQVSVTNNYTSEFVLAEPTLLEEVIANLVINADKYSPEGEGFELRVDEIGDGIAFRVLDRGPVVDEAELVLLFDSFHRSERTLALPGKALALAICKRLVEVQGGQMWAKLRPGGGLEFGFSLPGRAS